MASLKGKTLFATGGSRGIGLAIAARAARDGANIVIAAKTAEPNPKLPGTIFTAAREIEAAGGRCLPVQCDIRDETQIAKAVADAVERFGGIDILVNNAGRANRKPATALSLKEWDEVVGLNLTATFSCSRSAHPYLKKRGGGAIVNLASIMGLSGGLFPNASYQASKGGIVNLTRALALEWAADNIRVNAVAPTFVRTDLTVPIFSNPEVLKLVMSHTPLGRLPEVEDIAAAIAFLCSDAARCITGIVLPVDSGYLAR
jgi:NAD(P)-dependent dehydrogenase (short-subunit alcohol dehydrogenase family)